MTKLWLDFETYCDLDITKVGMYKYLHHNSFHTWCAAYAIDDGAVQLTEGDNETKILLNKIVNNIEDIKIYAHNADFERNVLKYLGHDIPLSRFVDTQALAATFGYPLALDKFCNAIGVVDGKDSSGTRLINKLCKPQNKTIKNPSGRWLPHTAPKDFEKLYKYCKQDVVAMRNAVKRLPIDELSKLEQYIWGHTVLQNERGVEIDIDSVRAIRHKLRAFKANKEEEFKIATGGNVQTVKQVKKLKEYLWDTGLDIPNLAKDTVEEYLQKDIPSKCRTILELRKQLAQSSVAKYDKMQLMCEPDSRVRGNLMYYGGHTGRFCIPPDAKVLTPTGWTNIVDWEEKEEKILMYKKGYFGWEKALKHCFDYKGEMYHLKSKVYEGLFTPEHQLPYYTHRGNPHACDAKDFNRGQIPISGEYKATKVYPSIITKIIVMTQADGSVCTNTRQGRCVVYGFKKKHKIERCRELLNEGNIPFSIATHKNGTTYIRIKWTDSPVWLRKSKIFNADLFNHNPKIFIHELMWWDAYVDASNNLKGFEYSSTIKTNAEWVVTMAHLAKYAATLSKKQTQQKWADLYRVYIRFKDKTEIKQKNITIEKYDGKVYCPEVSSGLFLMKYKDRISVTGNSGRGFQLHNLPRASVEDPVKVIEDFRTKSYKYILDAYKNVNETASALIRPMVTAPENKKLVVADYSSVENVVLHWLAGDVDTVNDFRDGICQYRKYSSARLGIPYDKVTKKQRNESKPDVLGLGFGGGYRALIKVAGDHGITLSKKVAVDRVSFYRKRYRLVPKLWRNVFDKCYKAIETKDPQVLITPAARMEFRCAGGYFFILLPSGRRLSYPGVKLDASWIIKVKGKSVRMSSAISYMGVRNNTWVRIGTHPGMLVENIVQALARDLLVYGMLCAEQAGFKIVASVHDEVIAEYDDSENAENILNDFCEYICTRQKWSESIPLRAEGYVSKRYKKD